MQERGQADERCYYSTRSDSSSNTRTAVEAVENYFALGGRKNSQDVNEQQFVRKLQHVWQETSRRADERLPIACARLGEC